ncbi:MAG TPA: DEAD/DEAH box helicase [Bacilli bacterium]|nr:DEAD/DEAH box helicase [Bacilli bacterium]
MAKFSQYAIKSSLLSALQNHGYDNLTPVQTEVIPDAMRGKSLVVQAPTGSGKTHSFLVPIINNIKVDDHEIQTIILSPTRELAKQIYDFAMQLAGGLSGINVALIAGGNDKSRDEEKLFSHPHIVIGTPGRLYDLGVENSVTSMAHVRTIVLDEADMLLDSGFFNLIDGLLGQISSQVMVFSATMTPALANLINHYLKGARVIQLSPKEPTSSRVSHFAIDTRHQPIEEVIKNFVIFYHPYFLLVFARTNEDARHYAQYLNQQGMNVGELHGGLSPRERKIMMKRIRNKEFSVVVASDVAARGIDLPDVSDILNVGFPSDMAYYFHRAGRTARYDRVGNSFLLYDNDQLTDLNELIKRNVGFQYLVYRDREFVLSNQKARKTIIKKENPDLTAKIKKAVAMNRSKKVKPGYKKKVKQAVDKVKRKHRQEVIRKDIRRQVEERKRQKTSDK